MRQVQTTEFLYKMHSLRNEHRVHGKETTEIGIGFRIQNTYRFN